MELVEHPSLEGFEHPGGFSFKNKLKHFVNKPTNTKKTQI